MAPAIRLAVLLTVLLLAHGSAPAQPAVAPAPHPTLDDLVLEYKRCGLPLPNQPPADLDKLDERFTDWISLAVLFRTRGFNDLASAAYTKALAQLSKREPFNNEGPLSIRRELYRGAWAYWKDQLTERNSNRREILSLLESLTKEEPGVFWWGENFLPDLRLTVAPRKSQPGSVEALIDDLTEHWESDKRGDEEGQDAYWKLVELGTDAIPALLDHLNDTRLTRYRWTMVKGTGDGIYILRVRTLVEYILNEFSGGRFDQEAYPLTVAELKEPKDHRWLEMVACGGEEAWLLDNVIYRGDRSEGRWPELNLLILRVIRAKYPYRLKDVYRMLPEYPEVRSEEIAKAIVASKLPVKDKIAFLEQGIATEKDIHQSYALESLADVDPAGFRTHLLRFIKEIPPEFRIGTEDNNELTVLSLIWKTDDPTCWEALTAATQRVSPEARLYFIRVAGWPVYPGEPDPGRRQRLEFLLRFLNANGVLEDIRDCRDLATFQLAKHFALLDQRVDPHTPKPAHSPRELSLLRDRVRELAERELARPEK